MSSHLTPEERQRIVEEQRLRNNEVLKSGLSLWLKIFLIVMGIVLASTICYVVFLGAMFAPLLRL